VTARACDRSGYQRRGKRRILLEPSLTQRGIDSRSLRRAHTPPHPRRRSTTAGLLETRTIKNAYEPRTKATGMTWEQWQEMLASRAQGKRLMTVAEMANEAVFVASERRAA